MTAKQQTYRPFYVTLALVVALISGLALTALNPFGKESMSTTIQNAVATTGAYWSAHWAEDFPYSRAFSPPHLFGTNAGLYSSQSTAAGPLPVCGTPSNSQDDYTTNNAGYCSQTDTLFWDAAWMNQSQTVGTGLLYLTVAHEFGHVVQYRLNLANSETQPELLSDCLAGVEIYGAAADGLIDLTPGEDQEFRNTFTAGGSSDSHGSVTDRVTAFEYGRTSGVDSCFGRY
jgi:hypothetical protein